MACKSDYILFRGDGSHYIRHHHSIWVTVQSPITVTMAQLTEVSSPQVLAGQTHIFIIVSPHSELAPPDTARSPCPSRPGFLSTVVYSQPTPNQKRLQVVIQQAQIKAHIAYYVRPPGTFGIKAEIMIMVDSLHRNRE